MRKKNCIKCQISYPNHCIVDGMCYQCRGEERDELQLILNGIKLDDGIPFEYQREYISTREYLVNSTDIKNVFIVAERLKMYPGAVKYKGIYCKGLYTNDIKNKIEKRTKITK